MGTNQQSEEARTLILCIVFLMTTVNRINSGYLAKTGIDVDPLNSGL